MSDTEQPKAKRATKAQKKERLSQVYSMLLAGCDFREISAYSRKNWDLSDGHLRRYIADAYQQMTETLVEDRKKLLARHIAQRRNLLARCLKANDRKNALAVLKDEADLEGLYVHKTALTTPDGQSPYDPTR